MVECPYGADMLNVLLQELFRSNFIVLQYKACIRKGIAVQWDCPMPADAAVPGGRPGAECSRGTGTSGSWFKQGADKAGAAAGTGT